MINSETIVIENHDTKQAVEFAQAVTNVRVNYDIKLSTEITVDVADQNLAMWNANYFQLGTPVIFRGDRFQIASAELQHSDGEYFKITLRMFPNAVQEMKKDKRPEKYKSNTGFQYAREVAKAFGLIPVVEELRGVKQSTIKVKVKNNTESVWDVLTRSASEIQFLCFVSEGRLFYVSPQWLLGRWGIDVVTGATVETIQGKKVPRDLYYIPLIYPADRNYRFYLLQMPNVRSSENSNLKAEGSAQLWVGDDYEEGIGNAYNIRAGMTVYLYGIKGFEQAYLVTSVDYIYGVSEPLEIAFATVKSLAPEDLSKINQKIAETVVISGTGGR